MAEAAAVAEALAFDRGQDYRLQAIAAAENDNYELAFELANQASTEFNQAHSSDLANRSLYDLGALLVQKGRFEEAKRILVPALQGFRDIGDLNRQASTLFLLGEGLAKLKKVDPARDLLEQACILSVALGLDSLTLRGYAALAGTLEIEHYMPKFIHVAVHAKSPAVRSEAITLSRNVIKIRQIHYSSTSGEQVWHTFPTKNMHEWIFSAGALDATKRVSGSTPGRVPTDGIPWNNILSADRTVLLTGVISSLASTLVTKSHSSLKLRVRIEADDRLESLNIGFAEAIHSSEVKAIVREWASQQDDFGYFVKLAKCFGFDLMNMQNSYQDDFIRITATKPSLK